LTPKLPKRVVPTQKLWRFLDHGPAPARWNMAVDAVLRRSHAEAGGSPTLRFYQWSQPTLSLGAGQKLPEPLSLERLHSLGLAVVRRPTGGRAVLHDGDLTYSVVAGAREGFPVSVTAVYRRLCRALQAGLARLGLQTSLGGPQTGTFSKFNCFARLGSGDLTWQGKKFVGSAQAWQGGTFLQHGAILLTSQAAAWQQLQAASDRQTAAPVISLAEILGSAPPLDLLKDALLRGFQEELGLTLTAGDLTPWELGLLPAELVVTEQLVP
jgi:lipoate-protein ligase A